jgi:hypothetical protein
MANREFMWSWLSLLENRQRALPLQKRGEEGRKLRLARALIVEEKKKVRLALARDDARLIGQFIVPCS